MRLRFEACRLGGRTGLDTLRFEVRDEGRALGDSEGAGDGEREEDGVMFACKSVEGIGEGTMVAGRGGVVADSRASFGVEVESSRDEVCPVCESVASNLPSVELGATGLAG